MKLGHVKEAHSPRNDDCPHNTDPRFDCTCKSAITRHRKPYREIRVALRPEFVEHHMKDKMVLRVYSDGLLEFRENGRRRTYATNVGRIYRGLVWGEAMAAAKASKKTKAKRRS